MLVHQGTERSAAVDRRLACTLAGVAGALNAAAFYAVGFFSANMTGNISTLSDHIAVGQWRAGAFYGGLVLAFIFGAAISTLLIDAGRRRDFGGIYALVILLEAALMTVLGAADQWFAPGWRLPVVVLGLAFLMGLQNAVVTRISEARVRTTHVSGMATDIGIELGLLYDAARGKGDEADAGAVRSRLRLHLETILSFLAGGIAGVALYRMAGGITFWIAAAVLAVIALSALFKTRRAGVTSLPNDM